MEVVEVSPPYDHADITSLLGVHAILECLGTMVRGGLLGTQPELADPPYDLAKPEQTDAEQRGT